jgi:predicted RNase H-like HicB family nuclease
MKYTYPAFFYPEKDGRYSVVVPDFPLATFGDNLADAMYMAADAIAGRILLALEDGDPLPLQSDIKTMKPERKDGFVSLIYGDTEELKMNHDDKPVKKTLTIPSWLNQAAEKKNINFSLTLKEALIEKIAQ